MLPQTVLLEIEAKAKERFLPIVGPEKGRLLEKLVKEKKPKSVLEVGTLVGYSSILMAQHMPEDGKIITLELNPQLAQLARENIKKAGVDHVVEVKVGDAKELIPELRGTFDLLFLDAAKEEYFNYLKAAEPKLFENAVVVADNVGIFADSMQDYLQYVRNSGKYKSRIYGVGNDAVEVSVRKW